MKSKGKQNESNMKAKDNQKEHVKQHEHKWETTGKQTQSKMKAKLKQKERKRKKERNPRGTQK